MLTVLLIITLVLLAASLYGIWYYRREALYWRAMYRQEIRGAAAEKIGFVIGYLGMNLILHYFFGKKGGE